MIAALLHARGGDVPEGFLEIELRPGRLAQLAGANCREHQQAKAEANVVGVGVGADGAQECREFFVRDVGVVFRGPGLEEFVQPFEGVVERSAGDAGKVVDLFAEAPHVAGLVDDSFALHIPQELHPFHRRDFREGA